MADKRISQLNAHTSPTGSDLLVIVSNNETKKITYADLVVSLTGSETDLSALNTFTQSIDGRVDNLESWSSSLDSTFATDLQVSIVSSSVAATIGVISQNTGLVSTSSFNQFTQSIDSRVDGIENLTSSFATTGSNEFTGSQNVSGSIVVDGTINASSITTPTISIGGGYIVSDGNDVSIGTDAILGYKILTNANTHTFQFGLDGNFTAPGNIIGATNFNTLLNKPTLISGSSQITALGFTSQSVSISSLNSFTASYFTDSASVDSRLDILQSWSSSLTDTFATDLEVSIVSSSVAATIGIISQNTGLVSTSSFNSFTQSIDSRVDSLENVTSSYLTSLNGAISSSSQLTSSFDIRYTLSGSVTQTTWDNISGKPNGIVSQSTDLTQLNQFTQSIDGRVDSLENATGSYITSLNGTISGSSQLTASFDVRYSLSGSGGGTIPAGTVSGSSQLTSSYDGRYLLTQSFNSFTASAQSVTTGSNSFNGTQTITGSLIITTGSFIGSQILANTSSLYLTSGSNLYVQNDGVVEITGSIIATSITGSIAATNGVISSSEQISASGFVSSSNVSTIQTITSASYAALTPVSGTLYIIIG